MALQTSIRETLPAPGVPDEALEDNLIDGRPVEDRSFETVEWVAAAACGLAIGGAVGGPIGAAVGVVVGGSAGVVAAEALERAMGRVAETTNAERPGR